MIEITTRLAAFLPLFQIKSIENIEKKYTTNKFLYF